MSPFDPDAYLAQKAGHAVLGPTTPAPDPAVDSIQQGQFDPDQYLQQKGIDQSPAAGDSLLEQAGTALEQGASGATLGASKVLETHGIPDLGIPAITTPQNIAAREAKYPITSTVSNIGGTVGLVGLTGGLGGLAEGAGLAAKIGAGALEGSLIGGVNSATDDWSQNKSLDGQKIAASAGLGALLGGAGPGIVGSLKGAASGVNKTLDYFSKVAGDAASGDGYAASLGKSYLAAGSKATDLVNGLTDNLSALYKSGKDAIASVYDDASQTKLGGALSSLSVDEAKRLAQASIDKVKNITIPGEGSEPLSGLSRGSANIITGNLEDLSDKLQKADTSLDVHNALTDFATKIDKGIKFDTLPTASQQVDQGIIRGVRSAIRGDLKNPELWGQSAPIYSDLSDHYSEYASARKNFERDFMKNRTAPNGQTVKVVDPAKINTFFKGAGQPGQNLRSDSLDAFIGSATKNAQYANEFGGFQQGLDNLTSQIERGKDFAGKADALAQLKQAKSAHHAGLGLLATIEALPIPTSVKAGALFLKRYVGGGSSFILGSDLASGAKAAGALARGVNTVTDKIGSGVNALFSGSASQSRKAEN